MSMFAVIFGLLGLGCKAIDSSSSSFQRFKDRERAKEYGKEFYSSQGKMYHTATNKRCNIDTNSLGERIVITEWGKVIRNYTVEERIKRRYEAICEGKTVYDYYGEKVSAYSDFPRTIYQDLETNDFYFEYCGFYIDIGTRQIVRYSDALVKKLEERGNEKYYIDIIERRKRNLQRTIDKGGML